MGRGRRRDSTQSVRVERTRNLWNARFPAPPPLSHGYVSWRDITLTNRGNQYRKPEISLDQTAEMGTHGGGDDWTMTMADRDTAYIVEITSGKPGNRVCCPPPPKMEHA